MKRQHTRLKQKAYKDVQPKFSNHHNWFDFKTAGISDTDTSLSRPTTHGCKLKYWKTWKVVSFIFCWAFFFNPSFTCYFCNTFKKPYFEDCGDTMSSTVYLTLLSIPSTCVGCFTVQFIITLVELFFVFATISDFASQKLFLLLFLALISGPQHRFVLSSCKWCTLDVSLLILYRICHFSTVDCFLSCLLV